MDGCMDEWLMDGWINEVINGGMDEWMDWLMNDWINKVIDGGMDKTMD